MGYRLLAVHQHDGLQRLLLSCSESCGVALESVRTGAQALRQVLDDPPDLVIVDVDLPDFDGLAWLEMLRRTREGRDLPAIIVSEKNVEERIVQAFANGADDFICYGTCDTLELQARLRAVLRRRFQREAQLSDGISLGSVTLDPSRHTCRVRGRSRDLRPREFELLEILMRKAGRVLSRPYLLETIWGMSHLADTRTVDVTVSRLRIALGKQAGRWIETVERFGYRFRDPDDARR